MPPDYHGRGGSMKLMTRVAVGFICLSASGMASAVDLYTSNNYPNRTVWITIYDLGKTRHLDYGCVNPGGNRRWSSGNYLNGSFYYVRGEVMTGKDCRGTKVCDTTVQVNPQVNPQDLHQAIGSFRAARSRNTSWLIIPNKNNC